MRVSDAIVSVVVPVFNGAATLPTTLASILAQTHRHLEVLVVDDGSTDDTAEVIARAAAADPRVVSVSYGANRGRSAARNAGIDAATGSWVAFVDADDLLIADRFEVLLDVAGRHPQSRVITDDRWGFTVGDDGSVSMDHRYPARHTWQWGGEHLIDRRRHFTDHLGHMDPIIERRHLLATGARYPERLSVGEDLAFCLMLLFGHPDPAAIRVGRVGYYYLLAPTNRAEGGRDSWLVAMDEVVEQTGSAELRRLVDRWQPIHSFQADYADQGMAKVGRLGPRDVPPRPDARPNRVAGAAFMGFLKGVRLAASFADRPHLAGAVADIEAQLQRGLPT